MCRTLIASAVVFGTVLGVAGCSNSAVPVSAQTIAPSSPAATRKPQSKLPTTLAQVGVPKLVVEHDGARADVTLDAVHWVAPLDGAEEIHGIYAFTIKNVGSKPFDWNENQLWSEDGSLTDVLSDAGTTNATRASISDIGTDLTPFTKWGQPFLIGTVKPGQTRRGLVSAGMAKDEHYVLSMDDMTDTTNISEDQALPIETTTKARWVLRSPAHP